MTRILSADDVDDLQVVADTLAAVVQLSDELPDRPSSRALRERCINILVLVRRRGITPQPDQVEAAYAALVADETS
jgi:hypothetical protein